MGSLIFGSSYIVKSTYSFLDSFYDSSHIKRQTLNGLGHTLSEIIYLLMYILTGLEGPGIRHVNYKRRGMQDV